MVVDDKNACCHEQLHSQGKSSGNHATVESYTGNSKAQLITVTTWSVQSKKIYSTRKFSVRESYTTHIILPHNSIKNKRFYYKLYSESWTKFLLFKQKKFLFRNLK